MTMNYEFKPCPFCGSTRIAGVTSSDDSRMFREFVCCEDCGASTTTHETKEQAVEAWNVRAERTCHIMAPNMESMPFGYCSECGATFESSPSLFCRGCGAKVVDE